MDDAQNTASTDVFEIVHTTSGTPTNGLGVGMSFILEDSESNIQEFGSIDVVSTTITDTSEASKMVFSTFASGNSATAMEATSTLLTLPGSLKIADGGSIGSE